MSQSMKGRNIQRIWLKLLPNERNSRHEMHKTYLESFIQHPFLRDNVCLLPSHRLCLCHDLQALFQFLYGNFFPSVHYCSHNSKQVTFEYYIFSSPSVSASVCQCTLCRECSYNAHYQAGYRYLCHTSRAFIWSSECFKGQTADFCGVHVLLLTCNTACYIVGCRQRVPKLVKIMLIWH